MREIRTCVAALLVLLSCAALAGADEVQDDLDALVERWIAALNTEDIDAFLACYWSDAVRIMYFPGATELTEGMAELRAAEEEAFANMDYQSMNLVYDEPVRFFPGDGHPVYVVANSGIGYMDIFEFEERDGRYRVIRQYLLPHPVAE